MIQALLLTCLGVFQQALPPAEAVLDRMEQVLAPVEDFSATLEGEVSMENVRVPKAVLRMYFKRPDKVHFESESFSMVPRDGLTMGPAEIRARYDARTVALIDTGGIRWYKLELSAREDQTRLRSALAYVDAGTWTLRRFESTPYEGRTVSFDFSYVTLDKRYVLVSEVTATFGSVGQKPEEALTIPDDAPSPASQLREMRRRLRDGHVRFRFSDYRVNTGLPDSLFSPKQ